MPSNTHRTGHVAAMIFGTQALVFTAAWGLSAGRNTDAARDYLGNLWHLPQYGVVLAALALALGWGALTELRARHHARAGVAAILTALVVLDPLLAPLHPPAWTLTMHCGAALLMAAALAMEQTRDPRVLTSRGMLVILGMIVIDMASDLPFLLFGRGVEVSYLNNTIHNGTLVHELWLPLALGTIGLGVVLSLWRTRDLRFVWLLPMLALGAVLLYFFVDPAEAALPALTPTSPQTAQLLHQIGWSHLTSAALLVSGLFLIRGDHKPVADTEDLRAG